jgi:DNA-binding transcriptional MerR regulator
MGKRSPEPSRQGSEEKESSGRHYSVDELAAAAGLPSRTVRHYQTEGLLPPPRREGRKAVYDQGHLRRLEAIAKLQERGLNLRTIRDALRQIDHGRLSLQDWLEVEADLSAPWLDESPLLLDEAALRERLGDSSHGLRVALERAGLFERQGRGEQRRYLVPSPGMLEIALRMNAAGVDIASGARAAEILRKRIRQACDEMIPVFAGRSGKGFGREPSREAVGEAIGAMRDVGVESVRIIFAQENEAAIRRAIRRGLIRAPQRVGRS